MFGGDPAPGVDVDGLGMFATGEGVPVMGLEPWIGEGPPVTGDGMFETGAGVEVIGPGVPFT